MSEHALLSPSSSSIWLNCSPAARLTEHMPNTSGVAADEGTLAHLLAETLLTYELGRIDKKTFKKAVEAIKKNELYNSEMMDYCTDYVYYVMAVYQTALQLSPDALIYLERKFDLSAYVPQGHGKCDVSIIADKVLFVIDLKYGKGVPVAAIGNKQARLYGLGAYTEFRDLYDIEEIEMHIVQPRIDNTSSDRISVAELMEWAADVVRPQAHIAFEGGGDFNAGKHCQFCRARPTCRANHDYQMQSLKDAFLEPELLTDEEIVNVITKAKEIEGWLTAVKDHALTEAETNGKKWPGMKLVEGISRRKYSDEMDVYKALTKSFLDEEIGKFKLFGLGELEKSIGKKEFTAIVTPLLIKPPGKPTLVPESDKRPELNSNEAAQKAFADSPE